MFRHKKVNKPAEPFNLIIILHLGERTFLTIIISNMLDQFTSPSLLTTAASCAMEK